MSRGNHYAQAAQSKPLPICPKCGATAREAKTQYGLRASHCDLWSWDRHPLVDAETHRARNAAHKAFDALWRGAKLDRSKAYLLLADEMNLAPEQCHMKLMDADTARRVLVAVSAIQQAKPAP